jgi:phosphatidylglycerophosphate synthase
MPLWMLLILFYRDLLMAYMRSLAAIKNVAMGARWSGKAKAAIQAVAIQLVAMLVLAKAMAADGAGVEGTDFWWPVVFGWAAGVCFLFAIRLRDPKLWVVAAFGVGNVVFLAAYWAFFSTAGAAPAWVLQVVAWADDIAFWILAFVTLLTAASLADYVRVVAALWRSERQAGGN